MKIHDFEGIPDHLNQELIDGNALVEVVESKSNGRVLKELRTVYGDFDPTLLSDSEKAALMAHDGGLYKGKEAASDDMPATMTRARFEKLSPSERVEFRRGRHPIVD